MRVFKLFPWCMTLKTLTLPGPQWHVPSTEKQKVADRHFPHHNRIMSPLDNAEKFKKELFTSTFVSVRTTKTFQLKRGFLVKNKSETVAMVLFLFILKYSSIWTNVNVIKINLVKLRVNSSSSKSWMCNERLQIFYTLGIFRAVSWPKQSRKPWQPQENPGYISSRHPCTEKLSKF